MANVTKKDISNAEASRYHQRGMEARGETWDLQLILNGDGTEETIATLAKFKKRGHLKPDVRRRVVAAASVALKDPAASAVSDVDREEKEGLLALQGSGFWLNAFVAELLCGFAGGERVTPQQVVLELAASIDAIESLPERSPERKVLTGESSGPSFDRPATTFQKMQNEILVLRKRVAIVRMCAEFAEQARDAEIDTMYGLFEMWRSGRVSSDSDGRVLNEALRRSVWVGTGA
jgi:hypothetical protein